MHETIHWEQSWLHYSKVHQCWRQEAIHYTVLEAPSCQMNHNWPYRLCNWQYQYRNWPYQYRNRPYRYTDYSTPFAVNQSLSESMQSPTSIESFFRFSFPRNQNQYIFFKLCEVPTVFPFINFSCEGSFFFRQSSKHLSVDRRRCEHRCFYMAASVGLVPYILADLEPCGELLTKQTSFLMQPYARLARISSQNFVSLFSPATISHASLHKMHVCIQH